MMRKSILLGLGLSLCVAFQSYAAGWQQDNNGWWWQNDDGTYPTSSWQWLDGNHDGVAECYYFGDNGYMLSNAQIEGYQVDKNGAWIVDGIVQSKTFSTDTDEENEESDDTMTEEWEQQQEFWKARLQCLAETRPWEKSLESYNQDKQGVFFEKRMFFYPNAIQYEAQSMSEEDKNGAEYGASGAASAIVEQYTGPGTVLVWYSQFCSGPEEIDYYLTCIKNNLEQQGYTAHMTVRINVDTYSVVQIIVNFLEKI